MLHSEIMTKLVRHGCCHQPDNMAMISVHSAGVLVRADGALQRLAHDSAIKGGASYEL